jgi:Flp pilus assembly protein TadG
MTRVYPSPPVSPRQVAGRRRKTQGGSALLEGSLVLLPLLALGFALLDFPLALFIQNTLQGAVREGCRFAITQQTGANGQDAAIKAVVEQFSMGFLTDADISATTSSFSVTYYDPNSSLTTAVTGTGSNAEGHICVVSATIKRKFMAPIWQATGLIPFSSTSSDVMEAPPNGVLPSR